MKPRYDESPLLAKAIELEQRIDRLVKAKTCPECKGKGDDCKCNKMAKAKCDCGKEPCECKSCPSCGSKMDKMGGCMKMSCTEGNVAKAEKCPSCGSKMEKGEKCPSCGGKMAKAQPGYQPEKITDVNPHFVAESGGQTKSGYFTTNGKTIQTEDGKPKKKKADKKADLARLGDRMNPHSGSGVEREDSAGEGSSQ